MTPTLLICILGSLVAIVALFVPPRDVAEPAPTGSAEVSIANFSFSATGPLAGGQEVLVVNNDAAAHTLTSTDGAFDTGLMQPGEQAVITLPTTPGDYAFFCEVHPSMTSAFTVSG